MAKFDESKIINALHTEKAEIGKKYWVSDELVDLKEEVEKEKTPYELKEVHKGYFYPFVIDTTEFQFLYPYEEPPKKRMTKIQIVEWLNKGNGVYKCGKGDFAYSHLLISVESFDEEVEEHFYIRPFGQTEWIEPTVDIYERDCKKE